MAHITDTGMAEGPGCKSLEDYEVKLHVPADLTGAELAMCIAIIRSGEAVSLKSVQRELPNAGVLVIARCDNQIVGVGAIKRLRTEYAAGIARKSGVEFPPETLELGYVAVDPVHQRRGLSRRLVQSLVSGREDRLFATTSVPAMKKVLERVGFAKRGNAWPGAHSQLSCWVRE
jgi:predicted N-acetyltransferase YhbS